MYSISTQTACFSQYSEELEKNTIANLDDAGWYLCSWFTLFRKCSQHLYIILKTTAEIPNTLRTNMILCIFWDFVILMYVKAPWGVLREKGKPIFPQVLVYMYYWTLDVTSLYSLHHNILLWMSQKKQKGFTEWARRRNNGKYIFCQGHGTGTTSTSST